MGYTTRFEGSFKTDRPLDAETYLELQDMEVDLKLDPRFYSRKETLYWKVQKDRQTVHADSVEKWRTYVEQLEWLARYLISKGYRLEGKVCYAGEVVTDAGTLSVHYNPESPDEWKRCEVWKQQAVFP